MKALYVMSSVCLVLALVISIVPTNHQALGINVHADANLKRSEVYEQAAEKTLRGEFNSSTSEDLSVKIRKFLETEMLKVWDNEELERSKQMQAVLDDPKLNDQSLAQFFRAKAREYREAWK